jgi:hypothetical protein
VFKLNPVASQGWFCRLQIEALLESGLKPAFITKQLPRNMSNQNQGHQI